ncbi:type II secretion system protein GspM [Marinagarivorans cellulosilyticus]|uniref:Type II secretion system protein M n=1 Tax=Marinagarivorans cellulosilyticus TaxID=2721545 RepID=A0AAN1WKC3_9GAMM|nr:type II secretion system protein GspM [Marinagarivorans cellulosilyticus]BCD99102.1 general secretion pathway protein M [Marinagarivorans cellulosilyticus]
MNDFKNWFLQNSPREQLLLAVGAIAVALTLLYLVLLAPMTKDRDKQITNNNAVLLQQAEVRRLASIVLGQQQGGGDQPRNLAQVTNQSLRNHGLRMEDFQPTGDSDVRVRLASVEFNKVMAWLDELENKEGVQVKEVSVTAGDVKGMLNNVTVKLHRN